MSVEIHDGDSIEMIEGHIFFVIIQKKKLQQQKLDSFFESSENKSDSQNSSSNNKRKREEENDKNEQKKNKKEEKKEEEREEKNDGKPVCIFGIGCYRKNPLHFVQFSHPKGHPNEPNIVSNSSNKQLNTTTPLNETPHQSKKQNPSPPPLPSSSPNKNSNHQNSHSNKSQNKKQEKKEAVETILNLVSENDEIDLICLQTPNTNFTTENGSQSKSNSQLNSKRKESEMERKVRLEVKDKLIDEDEEDEQLLNSILKNSSSTIKPNKPNSFTSQTQKPQMNVVEKWEGEEEEDGKYTLAFCSLSTSTFKYDLEEAGKVLFKALNSFLHQNKDLPFKLILLDLKESETLKTYRRIFKSNKLEDARFEIKVANICSLKSEFNLKAKFIVNSTNRDMTGKGGGINKALHSAIPQLLTQTQKYFSPPAKVGQVYPVPLPHNSTFTRKEGVCFVIHVYPPNMNPQRPDCLYNDYKKGNQLLYDSYTNLFNSFLSLTR